MNPLDFGVTNQRADFSGGIGGVTDHELFSSDSQPPGEFPRDAAMREHTLHGHADLPGMIEAPLGHGGERMIEIRICRQQQRCDAAMFQRTACARREPAAQHPADTRTADERKKPNPLVGDQFLRDIDRLGDHDLAPLGREACLVQDLREANTRQGCIVGRLHDDGTAGRNRRRDLMHDQVQRMIECADRDHDADRLTLRKGDPMLAGRRTPHWNEMTVLGTDCLDAQLQTVNRARNFDTRIDQRLAALRGSAARQLLVSRLHDLGGALERGDTLVNREPAVRIAIQAVRGRERKIRVRGVARLDDRQLGAVERGRNRGRAGRRSGTGYQQRESVHAPPLAGHAGAG